MPPTTTFLRLNPKATIPIRVFINRKEVSKNILETSINVNSSSSSSNSNYQKDQIRLKLSKVHRIKLSNKDLNELIQDIKPQLLKILYELSIDELNTINKSPGTTFRSNILKLPLSTENWTAYLIITHEDLQSIKQIISMPVFSSSEQDYLISSNKSSMNYSTLLKHELVYSQPKTLELQQEKGDSVTTPISLTNANAIETLGTPTPPPVNNGDDFNDQLEQFTAGSGTEDKKKFRSRYIDRRVLNIPLNIHVYSKLY